MRLSSSPTFNHQPAVHPHEPGHFLTTSLAGLVVALLGRRTWMGSALPPCGLAFCGANPLPGAGRESPGTLSVLRHRSCRTSGVLPFAFVPRAQTGCRRLAALCRVDFANPLVRPFCPHLPTPSVTLTSSHGGLFKCGQKLPGNEQ